MAEVTAHPPTDGLGGDIIVAGKDPSVFLPVGIPGKDGLCPWTRGLIRDDTDELLRRVCPQDPPHFD